MSAWFHNDRALVRELRRDTLHSAWVKNSVVGTGIFSAYGVELGAVVEWLDEDRMMVSDGGEAFGALWMSNLVRSRMGASERERFERVATKFGVRFDAQRKTFSSLASRATFADVVKRIAAVTLVVDGWRFVLEPVRRTEDVAQSSRIVDRVSKLGESRDWVTQEHVPVQVGPDHCWTARAALVRKASSVALVMLSDEPAEVGPRVAAWVDRARIPLVFLASARNYDAAREEIQFPGKAGIVKRAHSATTTANDVLQAAEGVWEGLHVA